MRLLIVLILGNPAPTRSSRKVLHITLASSLLQFPIGIVRSRSGYLIGCHYRHVVVEQSLIKRGYIGTCRTVDKHQLKIFILIISSLIFSGKQPFQNDRAALDNARHQYPPYRKGTYASWQCPLTEACNAFVSSNRCCCLLICCNKSLPTVPTPTTKRLSTCDSERKKESCMTLSALRRLPSAITKDILVSEAPCAQAITLIRCAPKR